MRLGYALGFTLKEVSGGKLGEIRTEELFRKHEDMWNHQVPFRRQEYQPGLALRTYRALTWLHYARGETQDQFTPFVFYWIAFNALYATESQLDGKEKTEQEAQKEYIGRLLGNQKARRQVSRTLVEVDGRIGDLVRETPTFAQDAKGVAKARSGTTAERLNQVVRRLGRIRNWMFHGGVARQSHVLGECVAAGTDVMTRLVPTFVDAMLNCQWEAGDWDDVPWSPDEYGEDTAHKERSDLRAAPSPWSRHPPRR